ncbi:hypothetical protein BDZ45DRAFT_245197 [Acephala macrosclerotiorum]|nr:hypothetical protein BDZ45DRAFT_245197 [Acephala macrosclerotiorum]
MLLIDLIRRRSIDTSSLMPNRRGIHKLFDTETEEYEHSAAVRLNIAADQNMEETFLNDRLSFCLTALVHDPYLTAEHTPMVTAKWDPASMFAMLEGRSRECCKLGDKEESARLGDILYSYYIGLMALHQMLANVVKMPERMKQEDGKAKLEEEAQLGKLLTDFIKTPQAKGFSLYASLARPGCYRKSSVGFFLAGLRFETSCWG